MQYNYDFEIASLFVMTIILIHLVFVRQFPGDKTRVFRILLLVSMAECCINILSSIGLANAALVPQSVNEVLVFAFFLLEGLSSYMIFRYCMTVCEYRGKEGRRIWLLGGVPWILFTVLVFLTPFTGFLYYFEDNAYYQGFGSVTGFWYIIYCFCLNILLLVKRRRVVNNRTKVNMGLYTVVAIVMILLQYHLKVVLLTSTGNALMLLTVYISMQNPNEMLDTVTGVGNENAFLAQMKNRMEREKAMTVITIHLRKMHYIHKILGMDNTNGILRAVGSYLTRLCGRFYVFRTSSDTFTVLVDEQHDGEALVKALQESFETEWTVQQNHHIALNMNMVVQHYPKDFETISEYAGMRQFLLEIARETGEMAVIEADRERMEGYSRRAKVEQAVLRAIREKSFEVYYQPIYSVRDRCIVSLEALVRLNDEELGYISPEEFIPLAERDGNIIYIGAQVLAECCRFLSHHVLSNMSLGIRTIQINVSAVQCLRQNLAETIIPVLERYHIPPSMITLEVTERTAISTPERMRRHMEELGDLGIKFAMDDYGSGNANCSYLVRFPFREVKLDKEIVWASFENEAAHIVLENEIRTIQRLGIPLVVEGVESKEQSTAMEELGVDYIQGYYYGRPLPERECLRYIRRFNANTEDYSRG